MTCRYTASERPAVHDVSFRVRRGEFVGIVGATGCGKTTLLYLMAGVIPHYIRADLTGDVRIDGWNTRERSLAEITEHIGVVLQDPESQLFNLIVRDELAWGPENRGVERREIASRVASTLDFFSIAHLRDRLTYDLSGGEKQRVALAAVHAVAPRTYLFDSPTSQLDPVGAAAVIASIRRLVDTHALTIVMVEDKIEELVQFADRLLLMHDGRIVLDASPRDFCLRTETLEAAGVRPPQVTELTKALIASGAGLLDVATTVEEALPALRRLLGTGTKRRVDGGTGLLPS